LRRHIGHHAFEAPEIGDLAADTFDMLERHGAHLGAGIGVPIDEAQQATQLVEAEAELTAPPNEAQPLEMVRAIDPIAAVAAGGGPA
jgi:hypothetical protein